MIRSRVLAVLGALALLAAFAPAGAQSNDDLFNDSHFHLTNYIQEGISITGFLKIHMRGAR